ncbi:MAG: hypothetical protein II080_09595 [Lachnospiraceae bacterium]|nr:hypothetical protein [Lachnospiraceae bacterium]
MNIAGSKELNVEGIEYPRISKDEIASMDIEQTVILIAAVGYQEILSQIQNDPKLRGFIAIPSIYLEALYEDLRMLLASKPPEGFRKNPLPFIPKVIHTFWFADNPMPQKYRDCLRSWEKYAPDMEIKIWNMHTYKPQDCLFYQQALQLRQWAFASDYARADVLRRYGGVYMDLDVEMLRPIDDLLYNDAYMSFESLDRIECGSGMGAQKGNRILEEICRSYEERPFIKADGSLDLSTCPVRFTKVIEQYGLEKNGGFQFVDDITIYPFEVLTGKSFDTGIEYRTNLSYTLHHHNGSWVPPSAKHAMEQRYLEIQRFLKEQDQKEF